MQSCCGIFPSAPTQIPLMKRAAQALVYLSIITALSLCAAELYLRYKTEQSLKAFANGSLKNTNYSYLYLPLTVKINHRIWNEFLVDKVSTRLRSLSQNLDEFEEKKNTALSTAERYRLGPPRKLLLEDFVRDPAESITFTAEINSAGFRGMERDIKKSRQLKRIISYGSYQTFGHRISQGDTYPEKLEKLLNRKGQKFEVWNA